MAELSESRGRRLREEDLADDPLVQFERWWREALAANLKEPSAMTLATVGDGRPSARLVLLRGFDARGFAFFTSYQSRKARELDAHPYAALVFYWSELDRQVRIEGPVERTSAEESDRYFASRPRESQLSAWASPQSEVLPARADLDARFDEFARRFEGVPVPRPPSWGGYRLRPEAIEFWQAGPHRLHDRLRYVRAQAGHWRIERLAP